MLPELPFFENISSSENTARSSIDSLESTEGFTPFAKEQLPETEIMSGEDGDEALKWDNLKTAFKRHYLLADIKADAQLRIEEMKMGERADNFVNEFRVLADESEYDDQALIHIFRKGLPFVLADKILNQPQGRPADLNGWFQMAADKKRRFEKKETTVNRLETGKLSEEDRKEYMKDGRCFRCTKQGHLS
ncbi:hypothetical protein Moror_12070 [Moniliophthora roreri MCA 2997]|uniref:Retrotransposon gag domain-containing protein n=1 Tax=Moniliophthora roreri (strain MCA 2997) TaxID=1381753 RepID=V2WTP5_MONRO|nr:hypothetical protein Moror_12070 [Moniliophthora roreri MCA 2997]